MPALGDLRGLTAGCHVCMDPHDLRQAYCADWKDTGSVVALLGKQYWQAMSELCASWPHLQADPQFTITDAGADPCSGRAADSGVGGSTIRSCSSRPGHRECYPGVVCGCVPILASLTTRTPSDTLIVHIAHLLVQHISTLSRRLHLACEAVYCPHADALHPNGQDSLVSRALLHCSTSSCVSLASGLWPIYKAGSRQIGPYMQFCKCHMHLPLWGESLSCKCNMTMVFLW